MPIDVTATYSGSTIVSLSRQSSVDVKYGSTTLATLTAASTKTLSCSGKVMNANVTVGSKTLSCSGKLMKTNVVVTAVTSPIQWKFTYTVSSTTYTFTQDTASATVTDKYKYVKSGTSWYIVLYASGSFKFTTRDQTVDICAVGGGGGAGGGGSNPSGYTGWSMHGGAGAGGYITTKSSQTPTVGTSYTITIGAKGTGGAAGGQGTYSSGSNGTAGGATKFGSLVTANGGGGGAGSYYNSGSGADSTSGTTSAAYMFGSSTYPQVGGRGSRRGGGATRPANAASGGNGNPGLITIRSHVS